MSTSWKEHVILQGPKNKKKRWLDQVGIRPTQLEVDAELGKMIWKKDGK